METSEVVWDQDQAHPPEEILERYAMGKATEAETEQVEEHLLICGECREALDESDHWIALMKAAALPEAPARPAAARIGRRWWQSLSGGSRDSNRSWIEGFRIPAIAGGIVAALAVFFVLPSVRQQQGSPVGVDAPAEVSLAAMRGRDLRVEVPAGAALRLRFEESVQPESAGSVVIVTSTGDPIWSGVPDTRVAAGKAGIGIVTPKLRPGEYWVRLFAPGGDQIKEYGLIAR